MNDIAEKISDDETLAFIHQYFFLCQLPVMSECESLMFEKILKRAEDDEVLDFLIQQIDHMLIHDMELVEDAKNDQSILRERLGTNTIPKYINRDIKSIGKVASV